MCELAFSLTRHRCMRSLAGHTIDNSAHAYLQQLCRLRMGPQVLTGRPASVCVCVYSFSSLSWLAAARLVLRHLQAVQPSRVLVRSYVSAVSVVCACGCRVALCRRECRKPVLNVAQGTVQLVWSTVKMPAALISERGSVILSLPWTAILHHNTWRPSGCLLFYQL